MLNFFHFLSWHVFLFVAFGLVDCSKEVTLVGRQLYRYYVDILCQHTVDINIIWNLDDAYKVMGDVCFEYMLPEDVLKDALCTTLYCNGQNVWHRNDQLTNVSKLTNQLTW